MQKCYNENGEKRSFLRILNLYFLKGDFILKEYHTLNELLVYLFNCIMDIEQKNLITGEFSDISNNDMHIIEAVGLQGHRNMSAVAKQLNITIGTLTITVNRLVKKGYVIRQRSEQDKRVVHLALSEKGQRAYAHHKQFHKQMIDGAIQYLSTEELKVLIKALSGLIDYFHNE